MKKSACFGLLCLLLVGMVAVAQENTHPHQTLIERFYQEIYAAGNTSLIPELVADDYIDHNQARWPTRDGIAHIVHLLRQRLPDLNVTIDHWYFKDDHVVVQVTFAGTLDQQPLRWTTMDAYRIADGKLAEAWHLLLGGQDGLPAMEPPRSGSNV
jgi:predicted SnoaL-like aldol condensation-catalyzing enzyme